MLYPPIKHGLWKMPHIEFDDVPRKLHLVRGLSMMFSHILSYVFPIFDRGFPRHVAGDQRVNFARGLWLLAEAAGKPAGVADGRTMGSLHPCSALKSLDLGAIAVQMTYPEVQLFRLR